MCAKKYKGTYQIVKICKAGNRKILARGLTLDKAKKQSFLYFKTCRSEIIIEKQFLAEKWYS